MYVLSTLGALVLAGYQLVRNVGSSAGLLPGCADVLLHLLSNKARAPVVTGWGLAGAAMCMVAGLLVMFRVIADVGASGYFSPSIAVQEWFCHLVIAKGFNPS